MKPHALIVSTRTDIRTKLQELLSSKGVMPHSYGEDLSSVRQLINYIFVYVDDPAIQLTSEIEELVRSSSKRTIIVTSRESELALKFPESKHFFVCDVIGDKMLDKNTQLSGLLIQASEEKHVYIASEDEYLYLASVKEVCDKMLETLFSYGSDSGFIFAQKLTIREFLSTLKKYIPDLIVSVDQAKAASKNLPLTTNSPRDVSLDFLRAHILAIQEEQLKRKFAKVNPAPVEEVKIRRKFSKKKLKIHTSKLKKRSIAMVCIALGTSLLLPFFMLLISLGAGGASLYFAKRFDLISAKRSLIFAGAFAKTSSKLFKAYSIIPGLSYLVKSPNTNAGAVARSVEIGERVLGVATSAELIPDTLLGGGGGDLHEISTELYLDLDALYKELAFLQSELEKNSLPFVTSFNTETIEEYRAYVLTARDISASLPSLLGYDQPKTYLLLLQNNMELRPTGGFIGSFALLTFRNGKIVDNTIYDVYSADGQLKGYVEPPQPIRDYLGEASWTLRDSNWDPDFPSSARRAEWFLDKTLDREVDGVIAVNLQVVEAVLDVLGEVYLADFGDTINSDNVYEKVQHEVEYNFFPGSRKKADYLTALNKAVLARLMDATSGDYAHLGKSLHDRLASRDIQLYLHDTKLQALNAQNGWSGGVVNPSCGETCYSNLVGIVEANVGVNKANYHVSRAAELEVEYNGEEVLNTLKVKLKNEESGTDRIPEERYYAYVRALADRNSSITSVSVSENMVVPDINRLPDRVEIGTIVEVLPGEEKEIIYKWRGSAEMLSKNGGTLRTRIWKQSGVDPIPFVADFKVPLGGSLSSEPALSLTSGKTLRYNTTLSTDSILTITWKE